MFKETLQYASLILTIVMAIFAIRFWIIIGRLRKKYEPAMSRLGGILAAGRWNKRDRLKLSKDQEDARANIIGQAKQILPFVANMPDNQIIALMQDEQFMRGLVTAGTIGKDFLGIIFDFFGKRKLQLPKLPGSKSSTEKAPGME